MVRLILFLNKNLSLLVAPDGIFLKRQRENSLHIKQVEYLLMKSLKYTTQKGFFFLKIISGVYQPVINMVICPISAKIVAVHRSLVQENNQHFYVLLILLNSMHTVVLVTNGIRRTTLMILLVQVQARNYRLIQLIFIV